MEITITLALWEATDKAQLERFMEQNLNKEIHIGELSYKINAGFMDKSTPSIALIKNDTGQVFYVKLSLIDPDYSNYSALDRASRLDLISDLGIEI